MNLPELRRIELLRGGGWVKSTRSTGSLCCVEVLAEDGPWVHVRDSKYRREVRGPWQLEPVLTVTREEFDRLIDSVTGVADALPVDLFVSRMPTGEVLLGSRVSGSVLRFFDHEWAAFCQGAQDGEFALPRLLLARV